MSVLKLVTIRTVGIVIKRRYIVLAESKSDICVGSFHDHIIAESCRNKLVV